MRKSDFLLFLSSSSSSFFFLIFFLQRQRGWGEGGIGFSRAVSRKTNPCARTERKDRPSEFERG